ncbi:MAG: hypothetical protein CL678_08340 [Bdellovibrionaceae bacterium]|nr:hypothetical protein [Pseudobdellovibrionaceae bacterium]|tara:strand:- start:731 stop:1657 length:927 start_codon:yes stop_codon:yes gene_type:complete
MNKKNIIGLILTLLVALPFIMDQENKTIEDFKAAKENFIELPQGRTYYEDRPGKKGTVIFTHGFSTPSFSVQKLAKDIHKDGYRTIIFDLYGRGLSERIEPPYTIETFTTQTLNLLKALKIEGPIHWVGLSMGSGIVLRIIKEHSELFKTVTLISPNGLPIRVPIVAQLVKIPYLGKYFLKSFGDLGLRKGLRKNFYQPERFPEFFDEAESKSEIIGSKDALQSTLMNFPFSDLIDEYRFLSQSKIPTLIFWGRYDEVTPYENHKKLLQLVPSAILHTIENARHLPHYEKPEETFETWKKFIHLYTKK